MSGVTGADPLHSHKSMYDFWSPPQNLTTNSLAWSEVNFSNNVVN